MTGARRMEGERADESLKLGPSHPRGAVSQPQAFVESGNVGFEGGQDGVAKRDCDKAVEDNERRDDGSEETGAEVRIRKSPLDPDRGVRVLTWWSIQTKA